MYVTCLSVYVYTSVHVCAQIYIHTCIYLCTYLYIFICTNVIKIRSLEILNILIYTELNILISFNFSYVCVYLREFRNSVPLGSGKCMPQRPEEDIRVPEIAV